MLKIFFDPYKVFISILIAAAFWLTPLGVSERVLPADETRMPIQEFLESPKLILATIPEVSADCSNNCKVPVCLRWVPIGGSCQPVNPWDIGCCTLWGTECDDTLPGCGPVDPPTYSPPTVSALPTCAAWGNSGWCVNNAAITITALDPQNFAMTISGNITVNGASTPFSCANPCDLSMPSGSGTVSYTATSATSGLSSAAGNTSFKFDPGDPIITSSISGSHSGSWHNSPGATVTVLSSDAISGLQSVSITRNGAAVTSPFSLTDGTHSISVIAMDVAGNQYTSAFTVKLDSVKPVISFSTVGFLSGAWYRSATVTVTATDITSGVQTLLTTVDGFSKASPIALLDGAHTIFATATDNAGNVQAASIDIQVDGTPPTIVPSNTGTAGLAGWWVSNVDMNASFSDTGSGVASQLFSPNGGTSWAALPYNLSTDGIHPVVFRSTDTAGNITEKKDTVKIDKSAPVLSVSNTGTLGGNGWYVSTVLVSATASDLTSGLASLRYNLDGVWKPYVSPFILGNGSHTVQFQASDNAGNIKTTTSQNFRVDTNVPSVIPTVTGTSGVNGWYVSNTQVSAVSSDAGSGLDQLKFALDGNAWQVYSEPISISDGLHTIQFQSTDIAGNTNSSSISVNVDTSAPQIISSETGTSGSNGWYVSDVTLEAANSDPTSGIASEKYRLDGGAWQDGANITVSTYGTHSVDFLVIDKAGNQTTNSRTFKIDQVPPQIRVTPTGETGANGWYVSSVDLTALSTDLTSGVSSLEYNQDGAGWKPISTAIMLIDGRHILQVRSTDHAGNQSSTSISINVDTVPPVQVLDLNGTIGSKGWYISNVSGSVSTSDITSGNVTTTITNDEDVVHSSRITLTDGIHNLQVNSMDEAGNSVSASAVVSVDTTAPTTMFSSPAPNSVGIGTVQIGGQSTEMTSGLSVNQISFDNLNWLSLPYSNSDWSYVWETADLPNGALSIYARGIDEAGNIGIPSQIRVVLDNHPPFLELSNSWNIWERGTLLVKANVTPLKSVRIVIRDPFMRYPNELFFDDLPAPKQIKWDRVIGNVTAPPGSYPVEVEACDIYGVCSIAIGTINIPEGISTPTMEPFVFPPPSTPPPEIAPTQVVIPIQVPQAIVATTEVSPIVSPPFKPLWPVIIVSLLLFVFAILLLLDPRPAALRSLAKTIYPSIRRINHDR